MSTRPMTQEELDAIHMRLGYDNSTTDDVCTLLDEVERLRALTTVDDDMVQRAARAMMEASPDAAYLTDDEHDWYVRDARAALDAALGTGEEA